MQKNADIYAKFGQPLLQFLCQKHKTLKNAAPLYKTSPQMLSHIIHGRKKCPDDLKTRFINSGFPVEFFARLEGIKDINTVNTFEDLKFLYLALREQYQNLRDLYEAKSKWVEDIKDKYGIGR